MPMNELNTDGVFWISMMFVVASIALAVYLKFFFKLKKQQAILALVFRFQKTFLITYNIAFSIYNY